MNPFVKLTVPLDPDEARPILTTLHAAGIEAYVENAHLSSLVPDLRRALGGMPVHVRADQREMAEALLARTEIGAQNLACPACGGPTLARQARFGAALSKITAIAGRPRGRAHRACLSCGYGWKPGGQAPFTVDELGYNPDAPLIDWRALARNFRAFLAWARSIGYQDRSK